MKKILHLALIAAIAIGTACEGPEGPPGPAGEQGTPGPQGPAGPQGEPGTAPNGTVLDLGGWTFEPDEEGNYALGLGFEDYGLEVSDTDVLMVYRLATVDEQNEVPIWAPLPVTMMGEQGMLQYSFVFSPLYMFIFIDATFDLAEFPGITDDQVFRIVVIPGEALEGARISGNPRDLSSYSYQEVVKMFKISDKNVPLYEQK